MLKPIPMTGFFKDLGIYALPLRFGNQKPIFSIAAVLPIHFIYRAKAAFFKRFWGLNWLGMPWLNLFQNYHSALHCGAETARNLDIKSNWIIHCRSQKAGNESSEIEKKHLLSRHATLEGHLNEY